MIFEYNGTEYEFPDNTSDEEALRLIQQDQNQPQQPSQPAMEPAAQPSLMQNAGEFWTKDIPEEGKGLFDRTMQRAERIEKPTVLGSMAQKATGSTGVFGNLVEGVAGVPERITRTVAGAVGTIGDAAGTALNVGADAVNSITNDGLKKVTDPALKLVADKVGDSKTAQAVTGWWSKLSDAEKANYGSAVDLLEIFGYGAGKATTKGAAKVGEKIGEGIEDTGKGFLGGEMKIKQNLAKKGYGKTIDEKKSNMLNNISKYNLESSVGNFSSMAKKADDMASERFDKVDEIINSIAKQPNSPTENIDDILLDAYKYAEDGTALGKDNPAKKIVSDIMETADKRGLTGEQPINVLVKFKKQLDPDGKLFTTGPVPGEDALDRDIRKRLYLSTVEKINGISEEVGILNREGKELLDIKAIAGDASSRIKNKEAISLTDRLVALAAAMGAITSAAAGSPKHSVLSLALGAGAYGATKALSQGRGASVLIKGGKAVKKVSNVTRRGASAGGVAAVGSLSNVRYGALSGMEE